MSRSLHSSEGVLLYSTQSTYNTAVTPATGIGVAEFNATDNGNFHQFFTIGNKNLYKNKGGVAQVDWQVRIPGLGSSAVLALGKRTNGQVPWITWAFGSDAVDAAPEAWQVQDSKVNTMEVSLDGGGIMSASLQGIGGYKTDAAGLTAVVPTEVPFMSYEAVLTLASVAFEVKSFSMTVNHNLTTESVIRGAARTTAQQRLWDYMTEGHELIEFHINVARVYSKAMQAGCPGVDGSMVLTMTEVCTPSNTFAITMTGCEFLTQERSMPADGYGGFAISGNSKGFTIV